MAGTKMNDLLQRLTGRRLMRPTVKSRAFDFGPGSVTTDEAIFLRELVARSAAHTGPIVEIGTLYGQTAVEMAIVKAPEQRIVTVDVYGWNPHGFDDEHHHRITSQVLRYLTATGHVEQVVSDKDDFYREYRGAAPALVFLDAIHTYEETARDIAWAKSAGAAMISGHDYSSDCPGVQRAVDEAGGLFEITDSLWLLKWQS